MKNKLLKRFSRFLRFAFFGYKPFWKRSLHIYITQCLCVCLTGYRLSPWRSYKHETGIIRTSMTWRSAIGGKFSRKVISSKTTWNDYATNAISLRLLAIFLFMLRKQLLCEFSHSCGEMSFSKKGMPPMLSYG